MKPDDREIDFIEFHDGTIARIEERGAGEIAIVFDHLYVCVRRGDDHAGWSYRAELVLSGVTRFVVDGDTKLNSPTRDGMVFADDADVRDEAGRVFDPRALLAGADARSFRMQYYSPDEVFLSGDIRHAKLVLLEAVERVEDCYVDTAAPAPSPDG